MSVHELVKSGDRWKCPIVIGIPTLGIVRFEWTNSLWNCVLPVNWASSTIAAPIPHISALQYHVAEAQNMIVLGALEQMKAKKWEWLLLIEDDVVAPPDMFIKFTRWMRDGRYPVVSGFYTTKGFPNEPMTFRGRGNGAYRDFKLGDVVWCDGVATGCLLISMKLLQVAWDESPGITLTKMQADNSVRQVKLREVFKTRREAGVDPESGGFWRKMGTSDLDFCDNIIDKGWLKKAGFPEAAKKKYPFPVDTSIGCGHIDLTSGVQYGPEF